MAEKIKRFFDEAEAIWEAIPSYIKVFLYATASSCIGLYFSRQLSFDSVLAIVVTNLGLYGVPRIVTQQTRKLL